MDLNKLETRELEAHLGKCVHAKCKFLIESECFDQTFLVRSNMEIGAK